MITAFAQMLRELQEREAAVLDGQDITHAPTIGDMYEGLTRDILDRAIPESAGVQIVDGFAVGPDGTLSPQLDCMLVVGEGEAVPYTGHFKWRVQNIIAVFEIKKNLYASELDDSYKKLQKVTEAYAAWIESENANKAVNIGATFQAFAKITGTYVDNYDAVRALSEELQAVFHTLVMEQLSPLRIVFGYNGYVDELGLREGFVGYLEKRKNERGFGVGSFPNLIVCGGSSLLKVTGHPYLSPIEDGQTAWNFYVSSSENPLWLLLELVWTKMSYVVGMAMPAEDTLRREILRPFLSGAMVRRDDQAGWQYTYQPISRELLSTSQSVTWAPDEIDQNEFTFLYALNGKGTEDTESGEFAAWAKERGIDVDSFLGRLIECRLIAKSGNFVRPTNQTSYFAFSPDGKTWVATDQNLLQIWMSEKLCQWRGQNVHEGGVKVYRSGFEKRAMWPL